MSELDNWKTIDDMSEDVIIKALRTRIAALEEALAPFAKLTPTILSEYGENVLAPHYWVVIGHPSKSDFTKKDIEKAKAVLYHEIS